MYKNNGEGHVKKSFLAVADQLFRFLTLPSDSDSYKWVLIKNVLAVGGWW